MLALGLELFSPTASSDAVTAGKKSHKVSTAEKLVKILRDEYGIPIAGGTIPVRRQKYSGSPHNGLYQGERI